MHFHSNDDFVNHRLAPSSPPKRSRSRRIASRPASNASRRTAFFLSTNSFPSPTTSSNVAQAKRSKRSWGRGRNLWTQRRRSCVRHLTPVARRCDASVIAWVERTELNDDLRSRHWSGSACAAADEVQAVLRLRDGVRAHSQ